MRHTWYQIFLAIFSLVCVSACSDTVHTGIGAMQGAKSASQADPCPYTFMTWNIVNLGKSKTNEDIDIMARVMYPAHIIAIQEVTASKQLGAQAVGKIGESLHRLARSQGESYTYEYVISDPTTSTGYGTERYAYFVRSDIPINRRDANLLQDVPDEVDREPFVFTITLDGVPVTFATFHAVPSDKKPAKELRVLTAHPLFTTAPRMIFAGDFNLSYQATDAILTPLSLTGNNTAPSTYKKSVHASGRYMNRQFDNVYTRGVRVCSSMVQDFMPLITNPVTGESLTRGLRVSDHAPLTLTIGVK